MQRDTADSVRTRPGDAGFGLIEQIIAMAVVVGALLGLLGTLGATAQGVNSARQRTIAVSLAKQAIEHLQGSAYTTVAMNLASVTGEALVGGTAPNQTFEGEFLVPGGAEPYRKLSVAVGTTFALRTFVTAVSADSSGYRRITVIVDWSATSPKHSMRFSSLVYPLDYASYPASSGGAESTGGLITVTGSLGGDTFGDVHVVLPGVRADTNASTLRTSIGAAAGASGVVGVDTGPVASLSCTGAGTDLVECPRQTLESIADNDSTSTTTNWVAGIAESFVGGGATTPGGATITTPAGTMTSRASTDLCGMCGFGDIDGVPWADTTVSTTSGSAAAFSSDHGVGALHGSLWTLASAWSATASVDHDLTGGGTVTSSARLDAPALGVLELQGAPSGFDGAVKVGAFTAGVSVMSGYTLVAPDVTTGTTTRQVQLWETTGTYPLGHYRTVNVVAGAATDQVASATFTIGDHVVLFNSRVQSQPSTFSTVGTAPRTDGAAQHPSVLLITVDVTVTSATLVETPVTTPAVALVTDSFTIVIDYGRVSAHDTWLAKAP